jgi:CRP-like cAMP-binding protein
LEITLAIDKFFYKATPLWDNLSAEVLDNLFSNTTTQSYKKNATIVHDFEYSAGIYNIRKGFIKMYSLNPNGSEDIVFILGKDSIFGITPIFNNERCGVFATAITDCEIELVSKETVKKEMEKSPEFSQAIVLYLAQMAKMLNIKLLDYARKPLLGRVAISLLALDNNLKLNSTLAFSREDLANYIGTAVESLVRQIKKLKTDNLIIVKGRKITIIDYNGLTKIATGSV